MVKAQSGPQTRDAVAKAIVVRKSAVRKDVRVRVPAIPKGIALFLQEVPRSKPRRLPNGCRANFSRLDYARLETLCDRLDGARLGARHDVGVSRQSCDWRAYVQARPRRCERRFCLSIQVAAEWRMS